MICTWRPWQSGSVASVMVLTTVVSTAFNITLFV